MNIIVTVKQVIDPNIPPSYMRLDPSCKRIVALSGVSAVMNGYDANALEEALRLKEKHGGKVTALGLGDQASREALKRAIAMGADAAVLISDSALENADSAVIGRALAAAIKKIGSFDLVLSGRQASDTDGGHVLHWIAEALALPAVTPVTRIESDDGRTMIVHRLMEEGFQRLRVELPALLGISSEINEPRSPGMRGVMTAKRALIPAWQAGDLGLQGVHPKVELRRLTMQTRTTNAQFIKGDTPAAQGAALADKLRELTLI